MLIPNFDNIPSELTTSTQWANWRSIPGKDGDKPTMQLFQPDGSLAKADDPWTWNTFETTKAAADQFDGVGIVLTKEDPYVGLDFDHCRCPAFDGVTPWAYSLDTVLPVVAAHISNLNSYAEISPSGKGIRVFLKSTMPMDSKCNGSIKAYQSGQYVTVTGHALDGFPRTIESRQEELETFMQTTLETPVKPPEQEAKPSQHTLDGNWKERLERAFKSKDGVEIHGLYYNNKPFDNPSHENDLALCSHFAYWFDGDAAVMDAAFRDSWRDKDKWDQAHDSDGRTYGEATIETAIAGCKSFYCDRPVEPSPEYLSGEPGLCQSITHISEMGWAGLGRVGRPSDK